MKKKTKPKSKKKKEEKMFETFMSSCGETDECQLVIQLGTKSRTKAFKIAKQIVKELNEIDV